MSLTYKVVNEVEHTIRRGYRSDVNGQLDLIVDLINKIEYYRSVILNLWWRS